MSRHIVPSLAVAAGLLMAGVTVAPAADPLASLQWKNRVVLVFAGRSDDPRLEQQRAVFRQMGAQARERDLKLVEVVGSTMQADALRSRFVVPPDGFKVVLIGKDGGSKLASDEPLQASVLMSTIDAMPMRRNEMGREAS